LGGEGYLYSFDSDARKWSLIKNMDNVDAWSLTYSPSDDMLYATVAEYVGNSHVLAGMNKMNAQGDVVEKIKFSRAILAEQHTPAFQAIAVANERLVILATPADQIRSLVLK
jgi:hypothetical protein